MKMRHAGGTRIEKAPRGKRLWVKLLAGLCSCLSITLGAGLIYLATEVVGGLTADALPLDRTVLGIPDEAILDDSITNIALFGVDDRGNSFQGNSDTMMILTIDNRHQKIKLTSILRDTKVELEEFGTARINAAHAYGGAPFAIRTLNRLFRLNIEDYITVNFGKMAEIIDAVGGVSLSITSEEAQEINNNLDLLANDDPTATISPQDYLDLSQGEQSLSLGEQQLNGNQAVAYSRIRAVGGDEERSRRQQKVIQALLTATQGRDMLSYLDLAKEILPLCKTSLGLEDIPAFLPILFHPFSIETLHIPGEAENPWGGIDETFQGNWVYIYDLDTAADHINEFLYETSSTTENTSVQTEKTSVPAGSSM